MGLGVWVCHVSRRRWFWVPAEIFFFFLSLVSVSKYRLLFAPSVLKLLLEWMFVPVELGVNIGYRWSFTLNISPGCSKLIPFRMMEATIFKRTFRRTFPRSQLWYTPLWALEAVPPTCWLGLICSQLRPWIDGSTALQIISDQLNLPQDSSVKVDNHLKPDVKQILKKNSYCLETLWPPCTYNICAPFGWNIHHNGHPIWLYSHHNFSLVKCESLCPCLDSSIINQ